MQRRLTCSLHLLIYLIIYLYQYGLRNIFISWVTIQYNFILLIKLFQLWSSGALSFGSSIPFDTFPSLWCVFLSTSLHSGTTDIQGSSCLFPAVVLEPAISWFFSLENGIKIWAISVLIATEILFLKGLLSCQSKEMYVYNNPYIYIYWKILSVTTCIYIRLHMSSYWCLQL